MTIKEFNEQLALFKSKHAINNPFEDMIEQVKLLQDPATQEKYNITTHFKDMIEQAKKMSKKAQEPTDETV